MSFLVSLTHLITLLYFVFFRLFCFPLCVCLYMFICFCFYLFEFAFTICFSIIFLFLGEGFLVFSWFGGFLFDLFFCFFWSSQSFFGLFVCLLVCFNTLYCQISLWDLGSRSRVWVSGRGVWVQDTRPPENSWPQGVLIGEHSCEGPHLNPRPSTTQLPAAPSAGRLARTTSKMSAGRLPTDTPKHITSHSPAYQREKTHLLISSHKCWLSKCKAFYSVNLKAYFQE